MKKLLIVDDDNDLLKLYNLAFTNAFFNVETSLTIPGAEELIKKTKYDAIVLDILFPDTDIFPTIRLIRSKGSPNAETPILILTNLYYGDKTKKALELGANECLFKVTQTPSTIIKSVMRLMTDNNSESKSE